MKALINFVVIVGAGVARLMLLHHCELKENLIGSCNGEGKECKTVINFVPRCL